MNCGQRTTKGFGRLFFYMILCVLCLVAVSCGIEAVYALAAPVSIRTASPTDTAGRYFTFRTTETGGYNNSSRGVFDGTSVFYRIYNNLNELDADRTSIDAANSEYSSSGYNRLSSLGYQQLKQIDTATNPMGIADVLFSQSGTDRIVEIRLFDEGWNLTNSSYNLPAFVIDYSGARPTNPQYNIRPLRRSNDKGFNFYVDSFPFSSPPSTNPSDFDDKPISTNSDTSFSSSPTAANRWYVNAYAVSVGQDTYLTPLYSQLLWLGYIQINQ